MPQRVQLERAQKDSRKPKRVELKRAQRQRGSKNKRALTDLGISRLDVKKELARINKERRDRAKKQTDKGDLAKAETKDVTQARIWDEGQNGLALLISAGGTKTFLSQFKLNGKWQTRTIGRFGEMKANDDSENVNIAAAREIVRNDRTLALQGIDPRKNDKQRSAGLQTYEQVVDEYITKHARVAQRTWQQTERTLKGTQKERKARIGIAALLNRPFAEIDVEDAYELLDKLVADGTGQKALLTLAWLRALWRWAWKRNYVATPLMDKVEITVVIKRKKLVFSDDAIRASWEAADKLPPVEAAYIKLVMLLVPRKGELCEARVSWLDDTENPTVLTTPPLDIKQSKLAQVAEEPRVYLSPIPPLAAEIIKSRLKEDAEAGGEDYLLFPSSRFPDTPIDPGTPLKEKVKRLGGPPNFQYHAWRHTVTSWLQKNGHDNFDRGLILNHAESGVTAKYSHSYPLDRKRKLLEKWEAHVTRIVEA